MMESTKAQRYSGTHDNTKRRFPSWTPKQHPSQT